MPKMNKNSKQKEFTTKSNGSKSISYETDTSLSDLVIAESTMLPAKQEVEVTPQDIQDAIVYPNGATSIDFMMPEDEREILEKNLNQYGDMEKMKKLLNTAKANKVISEDLKTLELISKTGELSNKIFDMMTDPKNLAVLEQYIQRKFEEGDIAKAYKEIGMMNKAMLDARETMLQKVKSGNSGKKAKIALKFTNDNGEDFVLGADVDV
nr:MAG TPA: hypothetical protein [Caudoviricetes sp.]